MSRTDRQPRYTHDTRALCEGCGASMRSHGTEHDGAVKRWECPECRRTSRTAGREISYV